MMGACGVFAALIAGCLWEKRRTTTATTNPMGLERWKHIIMGYTHGLYDWLQDSECAISLVVGLANQGPDYRHAFSMRGQIIKVSLHTYGSMYFYES